MKFARPLLFVSLTLAAGCAGRERVVPVAAVAPPPAPVAIVALPEGASAGMLVPEPLADGSFPTPNQGLSEAGTLWHLRAGLNVAALSCRGEQGDAIRAGYNRWLTRRKPGLAKVAASYAAESGAGFDDAMTRLYNFFSQIPARTGFCAAAASVMADVAATDGPMPAAIASARLAALDQPFTDFYRDYDAWRRGAPAQPVIAAAAVTPAGPPAHRPGALTLDLSSLPVDTKVVAAR